MINRGFAAVYLVGLVLLLSLGTFTIIRLNENKVPVFNPSTTSAIQPIPASASATLTPKALSSLPSATSQPTNKISPLSPTPSLTPTPQTKTITVSGFAYEDRTNDGLFNSDDPKLPYMQLLIYDSATSQWINSIYTGQDGSFTVTNTVKGNLVIKPGCNDNFCPKDGDREFSSSSANEKFAFRSASAPTGSNNGIIEGDLIIEGSRQYKFYLLDKDNNYYSNIEWAGGHFKAQNLANTKTYIIRISYGDNSPADTDVTLTPATPEQRTLQIHVK